MHSFTAEIGSRDYRVYRVASWNNIAIHQSVKMMKETNKESINIDPYLCKITISRLDKIEPVTV